MIFPSSFSTVQNFNDKQNFPGKKSLDSDCWQGGEDNDVENYQTLSADGASEFHSRRTLVFQQLHKKDAD